MCCVVHHHGEPHTLSYDIVKCCLNKQILMHQIYQNLFVFLDSLCEGQLACDDGLGHCRTECNSWEDEVHGKCGQFCKCCAAKIEGKNQRVSESYFMYDTYTLFCAVNIDLKIDKIVCFLHSSP